MKKKTVLSVMAVAMLFAISLYFVGGTYARYVSAFDGTAKVGIAKWAVKLGEGGDEKLDLTLTPEAATGYVVANKIAPSYSADGEVEIDLNGTEVAVGIIAEVDETQISEKLQALGFESYATDIQTEVTVEKADGNTNDQFTISGSAGDQDDPFVIQLPNNVAFTDGDKVKVTVKVTWDNASDTHNEEHTKVGEKESAELEIPVTLHVFQYIQKESYKPAA